LFLMLDFLFRTPFTETGMKIELFRKGGPRLPQIPVTKNFEVSLLAWDHSLKTK
jgi:hypothetical protein